MYQWNRRYALLIMIALALLLPRTAGAQGKAYCNITSVTCEQISNAVRVKIEADGALSVNIWKWWNGEMNNYYMDWNLVDKQLTSEWSPDCYPQVDKIRLHFTNACPRIGNVIQIGKYPVSHVRFLTTPEQDGGLGVDVEIVLYKPMRYRQFNFRGWGNGWDAYLWDHHDPAWFDVVQSPDQRKLTITAASDRLPEVREHRKLSDVPENNRELRVNAHGDLLDIHAQSAGLSDLVEAVGKASGKRIFLGDGIERVVTAELPDVTLDEFAHRIAECYSLVCGETKDGLLLEDLNGWSAASQEIIQSEKIPVRWIPADQAAGLLPNFLVEHVRLDAEGNSMIVSGSKELIQKVRADIEKIDRPVPQIELKVKVFESSSSANTLRELISGYSNEGVTVSLDPAEGGIFYSSLGVPDSNFHARLQALEADMKIKTRAESSLVVTGGETGELFTGVDKYILFQRRQGDSAPVVEPVSAGVKLLVTPRNGERTLSLDVDTSVTEVGEIDPITRMPVINTRSAGGAFRVRPGESILIGGLTQFQCDTVVRKIPVLGNLPILGKLFQKSTRINTKTELAFLITPQIVAAGQPVSSGTGNKKLSQDKAEWEK